MVPLPCLMKQSLAHPVNVLTLPCFLRPWVSRFSSASGRGPAALKLFDQVSCKETWNINWHIGTTTEAPLVNNYWTLKLWSQLSPQKAYTQALYWKRKATYVQFVFFPPVLRWAQGYGLLTIWWLRMCVLFWRATWQMWMSRRTKVLKCASMTLFGLLPLFPFLTKVLFPQVPGENLCLQSPPTLEILFGLW